MLSYFQAAILGILQGISELFPISSLGHSIILPALLGWNIDQNARQFLTFLVATHFATAAVLFFFYWNDWVRIVRGILRSIRFRSFAADPDAKLGWLLVVGTVPAGIVGILFQRQIQRLFIAPSYVAFFLALNGILLYVAELLGTKAKREAGLSDADQPSPPRFRGGSQPGSELCRFLRCFRDFRAQDLLSRADSWSAWLMKMRCDSHSCWRLRLSEPPLF